MRRGKVIFRIGALILVCVACAGLAVAQDEPQEEPEEGFGPVVSAYLGYLRNEQEVVDDRVSRHEVSAVYYRRNSNRIRALREVAIRIARETGNDYLPELEAAARNELGNLFESAAQETRDTSRRLDSQQHFQVSGHGARGRNFLHLRASRPVRAGRAVAATASTTCG